MTNTHLTLTIFIAHAQDLAIICGLFVVEDVMLQAGNENYKQGKNMKSNSNFTILNHQT
jgi:hypothetical protein